MAVVVKVTEKGNIYKSADRGIISDVEILNADKLNELISEKVNNFIREYNLQEIKKNRFQYYWEFGAILRDLYYNSDLVDYNEKDLFFENVRLHMDRVGDVFPKDDIKRRRNIPKQFFKLAGYPYNVARVTEWSQWSYLFDNTYLMESTGFDEWFKQILESGKYKFNESFTRLWAESFNLLFRKVDITEWTVEEFLKPLICTLDIINNLIKAGINIESREVRRKIKKTILNVLSLHRKEFILMQMGDMGQNDYVSTMSENILSLYYRI